MKLTPNQLPLGPWGPGVVHQIYMGAGRSVDERALARIVQRDRDMGIEHVLLHYGPRRAVDVYDKHSRVVVNHGLSCGASFGLDGHEDDARHHHDVLTAIEKAECMAEIASSHRCNAIVWDAEPAYDTGVSSADGAIDAEKLGAKFRSLAPDAFVAHQPWWKPSVHRRFPYKSFAMRANAVAPQTYFNNAETVQTYGKKRYATLMPVYERDWAVLEANFPPSADDPRFETFQGYGWNDIPWVLVREMLNRPLLIAWGEPEISDVFEACLRAVRILKMTSDRQGNVFYNPYDPATYKTAVLRWQQDYNASEVARRSGKVAEDNSLGYESLKAMRVFG